MLQIETVDSTFCVNVDKGENEVGAKGEKGGKDKKEKGRVGKGEGDGGGRGDGKGWRGEVGLGIRLDDGFRVSSIVRNSSADLFGTMYN